MSGERLTPRPRYLPNCPRFIYGDAGDLSMTLPATLLDYSLQAVGGNAEGDSGMRASFVVRRDELFTFTLRFFESEWPSVQAFIDWAQQGLPFLWYPDADNEDVLYAVQLEVPAVGGKYAVAPEANYPIVLLLTITITGAAFPVVQTDALLQVELVFMDHMSIGDTESRLRYDVIDGGWAYFATGGRDGGGCMVALSNGSFLGVFHNTVRDGAIHQGGMISTHDLMGQPISNPKILHDYDHVHVLVLPDYTIRAARVNNGFGGITYDYLGEATTYKVPATGMFTLESQMSLTPTVFYEAGGFVGANVYTPSGPIIGYPVVRAVGVDNRLILSGDTQSSSLGAFRVGAPLGTKVAGIGVTLPVGTKKRWLYDTYFAPAKPYADGTVSESIVSYEHKEEWGTIYNGLILEPAMVGMKITWGDVARWRNAAQADRDRTERLDVDTNIGDGPGLDGTWDEGDGPFYPDPIDLRTRNTIVDTAMDNFLTKLTRSGVRTIEAVGLHYLSGVATGRGTGFDPILIGGFGTWWNYYGPHPYDYQDDPDDGYDWPLGTKHTAFKAYLKLESGLYVMQRDHAPLGTPRYWGQQPPGYSLNPPSVLSRDPVSLRAWTPSKLPGVAYQGDLAEVNAADGATARQKWVQFDIARIGLDVAYHKFLIASQFPAQHPVARFENADFLDDPAHGLAAIYDTSVDFNGYFNDIFDGVRRMDWGDGTPLEEIPSGAAFPDDAAVVYHRYLLHGVYTQTLHVTNTKGLTSTFTREFTVPVGAAIANFRYAIDEYDPLTLHFTDLSGIVNGIVVSQAWNFGDSGTSSAQDPSHTFAAPGVYTITLDIVGDSGQTASVSVDITVGAEVGGGDCPLFEPGFMDDPWIQGDDFAGGNPPLPSYINTAAFDGYYGGTLTFRYTYDFNDYPGAGTSYDIDNSEQYDGHASLVGYYGSGAFGQYIWCDVTDDGDPTEGFPPDAAIGDTDLGSGNWPRRSWVRMIVKCETGVMSDASRTTPQSGLEICQIYIGNGFFGAFLRQGKIKLDVRRKALSGGLFASTNIADLADEADIATGAGGQWKELILAHVGDEVNHKMRVMAWFGDACSLTGTAPTIDQTLDNWDAAQDYAIVEMFNTFFTLSANPSVKKFWLGGFRTQPNKISPNPFALTIPSGTGYP